MKDVRWSAELQCFEGRCEACNEYYELDPESRHDLWPVDGRGLRVCRACDNLRCLVRTRKRRLDPVKRERDREASRAWYASLSPEERRAIRKSHIIDLERRRTYQRDWMRRYRERQREQAG